MLAPDHGQSALEQLPSTMRNSVPNLASGRHLASNSSVTPVPPAGSPTPLGGRSYSQSAGKSRQGSATSTGSIVDSRQVHLYLKQTTRKDSKTATYTLSPSRPISADSLTNLSPQSIPPPGPQETGTATTVQQNKANTRIVLPNNPNGGRPIPPPLTRRKTDPNMQKRPKSHYVGEIVFQVDDSIFLGGVEAAYNANLLCRLGIEYIVDISNVDVDKLPKSKRSDCPCLCPKQTAHSRARMTIPLDETEGGDVTGYFREVNIFIEKAKSCKKCVLIHSYNGKNRCALFAMEHLMTSRKIGLHKAEEWLKSVNPHVKVSENFYRSLKKWENLVARNDPRADTPQIENKPKAVVPPGAKKTAWT